MVVEERSVPITPIDTPARSSAPSAATWTIGAVADRAGLATSALRFYEDQGLIRSERNPAGHRRYRPDVVRRVSFIRVAQRVGLSLDEIRDALSTLPRSRTPNRTDWARLAASWQPLIDERIRLLEGLRDRLSGCIGCGCLSLEVCELYNPDDEMGRQGPGPRNLA